MENHRKTNDQWPLMINGHAKGTDELKVPTISKAYVLGLCKGISHQHMALYVTVPPFWDPEIPIDHVVYLPEPMFSNINY